MNNEKNAALLLELPTNALLEPNLGAEFSVPGDDALDEIGGVVRNTDDPVEWTDALEVALGSDPGSAMQIERLAAVQMLAGAGGPVGARLLAAFWTQPDVGAFAELLAKEQGFVALLTLLTHRSRGPLDLLPLARGTHRLISLGDQLCSIGQRQTGFDLLTAASLVQANHGNGQVVFTVERELAATVAGILAAPAPYANGFEGSLAGISQFAGLVLVDLEGDHEFYAHGFPVLIGAGEAALGGAMLTTANEVAGKPDDGKAAVIDKARIRKLVLDNIMSTSVLLEFLRDPKVCSIPGLIEEVVNRTRNPQIVETVITHRHLHTGFANKGVPLACLRSPVNVSARILRKFIHVKYVSRMDLKRLAADRAGTRREVGREIEKYLESLA